MYEATLWVADATGFKDTLALIGSGALGQRSMNVIRTRNCEA